MCLAQGESQSLNDTTIKEFSDWIIKLGDGNLSEPNDGVVEIHIPSEFLILEFNDPIEAIMKSTYPLLAQNYSHDKFLQSRAILASRIETVNEINDYVLSLILGMICTLIKYCIYFI